MRVWPVLVVALFSSLAFGDEKLERMTKEYLSLRQDVLVRDYLARNPAIKEVADGYESALMSMIAIIKEYTTVLSFMETHKDASTLVAGYALAGGQVPREKLALTTRASVAQHVVEAQLMAQSFTGQLVTWYRAIREQNLSEPMDGPPKVRARKTNNAMQTISEEGHVVGHKKDDQ